MGASFGLTRRAAVRGAALLTAPLVLGAARPARGEAVGVVGATAERIQDRARQFLNQFSAPGVSLAYGHNSAIAFMGAYGFADPQTGEPLTTGHRLRIASVSKPITAAAVMMLAEHGRIRLDRPVFGAHGLLGAWFPIDARAPHADWLQAITVDHLLTHTAGGWTNDGSDPMFRYPGAGHADLIAATLREAPLINPPGSAYAYSNFGYCLLGRVVEAASGQSYEQFVRSQLLRLAGAEGMEVGGNTRGERRPGEAVYVGQGGDNPYSFDLRRMDAHGGWIASAADLVRFGQRINGDDALPDLIRPQSIALMRTPSGATQDYGRGWAINPAHANRWHSGALPGLVSMLILQAGGTIFAGLANTLARDGRDANAGLESLLWDVRALLYG